MELREILSRCDHTLLRVDATAAEIRALCDQGMRYGCASVCIPPCHVAGAKKYVGDRLRICTVIGFPNGYNTPAVKAFEAAEAIRNGADEVDMVINLAMVKDGCWDDVAADIRAVREVSRVHACTDVTGFGLLGHSYEMASGSGVTVRLHGAALPLLPQAASPSTRMRERQRHRARLVRDFMLVSPFCPACKRNGPQRPGSRCASCMCRFIELPIYHANILHDFAPFRNR